MPRKKVASSATPSTTNRSYPQSRRIVVAVFGAWLLLTGCSGEFVDVLTSVGETYATNPESTTVTEAISAYSEQMEDSSAAIYDRMNENLERARLEAQAAETASRQRPNPGPPHPGNGAWGVVADEDVRSDSKSRPNLSGLWKKEGSSIRIRFAGGGTQYSGTFYGRTNEGRNIQLPIRNLNASSQGRSSSYYEGEIDCRDIGRGGVKYFRVSHYYGKYRDREKVTFRWGCTLGSDDLGGLYRE